MTNLLLALHQPTLSHHLRDLHAVLMGGCSNHLPVRPPQRRPSFDGLRRYSRWLRFHHACTVTCRVGFHVRYPSCVLFRDRRLLTSVLFRDPNVGAQYRWSAKFAPAAPRFWGLMQGTSCTSLLQYGVM